MTKDYIIYHQVKSGVDCPDGIAAAWVASKKYPDAKIVGAVYQEPPPIDPQKNDRIIIVDFSYPAQILEDWADRGCEVIMLDHHKTAMKDFSGLSDRILAKFDMNECGATLAWKTFFPGRSMPVFLEFVRSRDLWLDCDLFADPIPETLMVHEAIAIERNSRKSLADKLYLYDLLKYMDRHDLLTWAKGKALEALKGKREAIAEIASRFEWRPFNGVSISSGKVTIGEVTIGEVTIPVVELSPDGSEDRYVSDICACINKTIKPWFCVCIKSDGGWELRSDRNGSNTDVGAIARSLGGGGHHNAAGFKS